MPRVETVPTASRLRLDAIDLVRGVVMILMILDHTRDFVHKGGQFDDPLDPASTTILLYLTRWVTHLCAPTFVLLAGLGVGLRRIRGASLDDNAWFLFTRGAWLMPLELVLFRVIIWWNVDVASFAAFLQVIWAIGVSMMVLEHAGAAAPRRRSASSAAVILVGHNLLDGIGVPFWLPGQRRPAADAGRHPVDAAAPERLLPDRRPGRAGRVRPLPGAAVAGRPRGRVTCWRESIDWPSRRRGVRVPRHRPRSMMLVAFVRAADVERLRRTTEHWAPQPTLVQSAMAYHERARSTGPSLAYVLVMLLAGADAALAALDGARSLAGGFWGAIVVTFGRVPFFFYVLQWITAHIIRDDRDGCCCGGEPRRHTSCTSSTTSASSLGARHRRATLDGLRLLDPQPCSRSTRSAAGSPASRRRRRDWWLSYL